MKRLRKLLLILLVVASALIAGGWIFQRLPPPAHGEYAATLAGAYDVTVQFVPGQALARANLRAAEYRDDGWFETPVSTPTFRLFTRGTRMAAFLAEDVPTGVRLTEFKRK